MPRAKTYFTIEEQCRRTLSLTNEWVKLYTPFIKLLPMDYVSDYRQTHDTVARDIRASSGLKFKTSFIEFLSFFYGDEEWRFGNWVFGIVRKNTRLLLAGDVVLVLLCNGTDRLPVWCASTKGKLVTGYYIETDRLDVPGDISLVEPPDELIGQELTHPDALAFMLSLRAGIGPQLGRRV